MILEVLKNIYESSKEINLINEILSKFTGFDFLYTLNLLFKSTSKLLVITSLETLIVSLLFKEEFVEKPNI